MGRGMRDGRRVDLRSVLWVSGRARGGGGGAGGGGGGEGDGGGKGRRGRLERRVDSGAVEMRRLRAGVGVEGTEATVSWLAS